MAKKYIIIKNGMGHVNSKSFKVEFGADWDSISYIEIKAGDIYVEAGDEKKYTYKGKTKTFKYVKIGDNKYYINSELLTSIKKYYLTKKTKRKTSAGKIKDSYKNKEKGYMVYLLEKKFKSGKKDLNKVWMVKHKVVGYFWGTELSNTNPTTDSGKAKNNEILKDNSSEDSTETKALDDGSVKSYKEAMVNRLIPSLIPYGLYTQSQIQYKKFSRFFRDPVIDPDSAITGTKEYLFFTKPDLHLLDKSGNTLVLNPELAGNTFFKEMRSRYPDLLLQLQHSADGELLNKTRYGGSYSSYLSQTLSYFVTGNLDLTSTTAKTVDTPENVFGNSITYRADGHEGDFNLNFSISFKDDKYLTMYNYFKIWEEYSKLKKKGLVTPPALKYTQRRILHDQIGIYKFIVAEDGETILYYAYILGAYPLTLPRDSFSSLTETPTYNIDWQGFHIEDMNPEILSDFNFVATNRRANGAYYSGSKEQNFKSVMADLAPMYDDNYNEPYRYPLYHPYVYAIHTSNQPCKTTYKLVWRQDKAIYKSFNKPRSGTFIYKIKTK